MTPDEITLFKGGACFPFDYDHTNPVAIFTYDSSDWGLYSADGNIVVGDTIAPRLDDTNTSLSGVWRLSIMLLQLQSYTDAHVHWDGAGFTVEYTVDGGTSWLALSDDGVVALPANSDFDLRVTFPGGIVADTSSLTSLTVYVFDTEKIISTDGIRTLTFSQDSISGGALAVDTPVTVSAADTSATLVGATPIGSIDYNIGTIEAWVTPTTTTVFTLSQPTTVTNLLTPEQATALAGTGTATGQTGVTSTLSSDTTWAADGSTSARITENAGGDGSTGSIRYFTPLDADRFSVTPGETLYCEVTVNPGNQSGKVFTLYIENYDISTSTWVGSPIADSQTLTDITTLRGSIVVPADAEKAHLMIACQGPDDGGYFMVDKLGVYRGGLPTQWEPRVVSTIYVNGVAGAAITPGVRQHVVAVLEDPRNDFFTIGPNLSIDHLGLYGEQMSATDVSSLYSTNINGSPTISVIDSATITVTESTPATDIYAYNWSIVTGGSV